MTCIFFEQITRATATAIHSVKEKYRRLRPFQLSTAIKPLPNIAARAQSNAYPSGHAMFGAEAALLLTRMVPEREAELLARGRECGKERIAGGVAYPSDWEAGQVGAIVMVQLMMKKPEFRADCEATRSEIRRGLGLAP